MKIRRRLAPHNLISPGREENGRMGITPFREKNPADSKSKNIGKFAV